LADRQLLVLRIFCRSCNACIPSTNSDAEVSDDEVVASILQRLHSCGIDATQKIVDFTGRPPPLLDDGNSITKLVS
jgi:hypothetical protein